MLACGEISRVLVTAGKPKADIYPSGQLPHISFVGTFDVTSVIFMLAKGNNDGLDWPLWFCVFKQAILCQNFGHSHETQVSLQWYSV